MKEKLKRNTKPTLADKIFEKHVGLNAELGYLPIKKEDVMSAIKEALTVNELLEE